MRMYHTHLSTIIAKPTNRLLNSNRFFVDKSKNISLQLVARQYTNKYYLHHLYTTSVLLIHNLTCWKAIVLPSVPVVQESKEAVPGLAPTGAACTANQLRSAVPLEQPLNSNTQALNPYWFSDSSQTAASSPHSGLLTQWPHEDKTLVSYPLRKGSEYRTCLQKIRFPLDVLTLSFPTL